MSADALHASEGHETLARIEKRLCEARWAQRGAVSPFGPARWLSNGRDLMLHFEQPRGPRRFPDDPVPAPLRGDEFEPPYSDY